MLNDREKLIVGQLQEKRAEELLYGKGFKKEGKTRKKQFISCKSSVSKDLKAQKNRKTHLKENL